MREYLHRLALDKEEGFGAALIKILLYVLSLIYGLIVRMLIFIYATRPYRLKCKVISVGNITLGGTGKTPLVELIANYLKEHGHKVAILSRGYKRKANREATSSKLRLSDNALAAGALSYDVMGDEPYMLQCNLKDIPVIVDANRIRSGARAIKDYNVDTVILDDGFQQWKIKKDLEIVVINAGSPFGNRHMIPRGILRQPISTLKEAEVFILTKANLSADLKKLKDFLSRINPGALIFESLHAPVGFYDLMEGQRRLLDTSAFGGKTATLISGIADPASFENTVKNIGVSIGLSFRFADHHHYSKKDFENIAEESKKKNIALIITTEKDAVKIRELNEFMSLASLRVFVLRIELKILNDEERFYSRLLKLYNV